MTRLADILTISSARTADPLASGIDLPAQQRGQMIFIDAVNEVTRERSERSMSYLKPEHQQRIANAYHAFKDVEGFARVASLADVRANDGNLSIPLYVRGKSLSDEKGEYATNGLKTAIQAWEQSAANLDIAVSELLKTIR